MNAIFSRVRNKGRAFLLATLLMAGILLSVVAAPSVHAAQAKGMSVSASFVIGQPYFTSSGSGTSQTQMNTPESIAFDGNGGAYIADTGNNRVLHFPASCLSNHTNGCAADLVIGQPDFTSNKAGVSQTQLDTLESVTTDGNGGIYVADTHNDRIVHFPASCLSSHAQSCAADLVIGQPDFTANQAGISQTQMDSPEGVTFDGKGGVYVTDSGNNRILHFPASCLSAHTNGCNADLVLGQSDFTSNQDGTGQKQMSAPMDVAVDGSGGVYVTDIGNNRVLHFPASCLNSHTNGCDADLVLGKPTFTATGFGISQTLMEFPVGAEVDQKGDLYVVDGANRVVRFPSTCLSKHTNSCAADLVIGQPDFVSAGFGTSQTEMEGPVDIDLDSQGNLFVVDMSNNRVLYFASSDFPSSVASDSATISGTASLVYGQTNFTSSKSGTSRTLIDQPRGAAVDAYGGIWVADSGNNRVLHFPASCYDKHTNGCAADLVIGQKNFTSFGHSQFTSPWSVAVDSGGGIWVVDFGDNRVLHFPASCLSNHKNGCAADQVIGQSDLKSTSAGAKQNMVNGPLGIAIDGSGNVWVVDNGNNRVLRFPTSCLNTHKNGCDADLVLGQPDFTTTTNAISQTQVANPHRVAFDTKGGIYIADSDYNRVLHFPASCINNSTNGCAADLVLGQSDYIYDVNATSQSQMDVAAGVATDGAGGVFVSDDHNNRILHFPASCLSNHTNGCNADQVIGQPDFSTSDAGTSQLQLSNPDSIAVGCTGGFFVTDVNNNRVVYFPAVGKALHTNTCRRQPTSTGVLLWVWLLIGLGVIGAIGATGYVIFNHQRAKTPASVESPA
jgi:sugar lactone lactonase YvrE